jgi:hypothetical protein
MVKFWNSDVEYVVDDHWSWRLVAIVIVIEFVIVIVIVFVMVDVIAMFLVLWKVINLHEYLPTCFGNATTPTKSVEIQAIQTECWTVAFVVSSVVAIDDIAADHRNHWSPESSLPLIHRASERFEQTQ